MTEDGSPPLLELTFSRAAWVVSAVLTLASAAGTAGCIVAVVVQPDPMPVVFGGLLTVATLLFAWLTAWCFLRRVRLFAWGFTTRGLLSESSLRFEEIQSVTLSPMSQIGVDPIARALFRGSAAKVSLYAFPAARALEVGSYALSRVIPRLADETEVRMRGGEDVRFGNAKLTAHGVTAQNKTIAWHEIERANFSPEGLRIFPKGRPEGTIVLAQNTTNLHVLVEIAARMLARGDSHIPGPSGPAAGGERVRGFPELDPELGVLVCGKGRPGVSRMVVAVLAVVPALAAVLGMPVPLRVALLIGAAVMALIWWAMGRSGFAVYERGIRGVKKRVVFAEADHLTYHVVDQYQNGVYSGRQVSLHLESANGKIGYAGLGAKNEGICTAVLDRVVPGLVERKWRELQAGGEVKAGKLVLTRGSVRWKKEEIPFSDVTSFEARQGFLHVWKRGKEMSWAMVSFGERDARLLTPLMERMLAERAKVA